MALYEILRPVASFWYAYHLTRGADIPQPRTSPTASSGAGTPARILLLGNGPAHGWGVVSHQLALTGALANRLGARCGRAARVDYVGEEMMNAAAAPAWLRRADLATYDAVVVVMGMSDAVRLTPVPQWTASMRTVLGALRAGLPETSPILVAEIQAVRSVPVYDSLLGGVGQRHADRLNEATRTLVTEFERTWPFELGEPAPRHGGALGSTALYSDWADVIVDAIVPVLPVDCATGRDAVPSAPAWAGLERAKLMASGAPDSELARITAAARKAFKVPVAGVSLLEGDEVHYLGAGQPVAIPSEYAHCTLVVENGAPLVVQRSSLDSRFRGNPVIDLTKGDFYAGHPLYSSSGDAIGSFCLMGTAPRRMSPAAMERLGQFAAMAQIELWKLEAAAPDAVGVTDVQEPELA
ncbi:GAF domain-containing protein [Herbiconiux sp. L3-i23]|uniref:GAF domain-containing protein n=1 Tax=Herbiconiux sp. L3-i23 TaxID=2905871 RepID=UPI0020477729|nr:GAF domain-containing protein [Herbiconiux sp. L3-i23]BDI22574.1 hypothetical protein L3i23_13500 [Herbiconiux sp. L3-i23]